MVNTNGFPYVNLKLDPLGKRVRANSHQTLFRPGFNYFVNILEHILTTVPEVYEKNLRFTGDTICNGRACHKIEIYFPDFNFISYKVKEKGESITSISAKYALNDYEIYEKNKNYWYDDEIDVGNTIIIPNHYAKHTLLLIEKANLLPMHIKASDDKGLFEEYLFNSLQINLPFSEQEFSSDNKAYHF